MPVRDIMTSDPACCTPDTSLQEVAQLMVDNDCGAIPVVDNEKSMKPVGVITDRDIVCRGLAAGLNLLNATAKECMTKNVITTLFGADIEAAAELLEEHEIRRIVVVDEQGKVVGIVALADLARSTPSEAHEVVEAVSQPS